ncbi:RagB/SusD family nutrient uptake outer membrane protein [Hymenobacter sp. GOD-10R]|uniref:RagB/SusD family nutrient uptake outer membrane protein n=1 Tax=Hymenobacter sp. GOD-10R TaxID=3093922 RepID=UPI002D79CC7F|nr:RagB/SusD family nutrient uptake outer membrane protein [Hymenobacter sp. GOD-10R]WRQ29782.1 RagB/SusD family nutrient uptake outer membrane protein [Hymenobacter sp. GOD-10R]
MLTLVSALTLAGVFTSCDLVEVDKVTDPTNPSLTDVTTNASQAQLNALGVGVEASLRLGHVNNGPNNQILGTLGREVFNLALNEPRWYTELLGTRGALDNNAFYSSAAYNGFGRVIRSSKVFLASAQATAVISDQQKQGIAGFCHTYEALGKLHLLNLMGENGIRVDLDDYLKPGKFVPPAEALTNIRQLLDQAATELAAAGATFAFPLSSGYAGFNTPTTFLKVNRALAARVALYQGDNAGTLAALGQSFYDPAGSLTIGPKIVFAPTVAGDAGNPYYQVANGTQNALIVAAPNFVTEAETGDLRLSKAPLRTGPARSGNTVPSTYEVRLFSSQTAPLDIIRNEELILIAAEAKAKTGNTTGALEDINTIRTKAGGLTARTAASFTQQSDYIDEILKQRRYSLFYEGHRLVDLRRLNRLNANPAPGQTLPYISGTTTAGTFRLFDRLEKPFAEVSWDVANP